MFVARVLSHGNLFGALHIASSERALSIVIGSMGLSEWGDDHLSCLLLAAAGESPHRLDDDSPRRIANALLARMSDEAEPSWLFYAAALVRPGAVEVCHAGDVRIQLVRDEVVVQSTIDHIFGNLVMTGDDARVHPNRGIVMRSLKHGEPPPDCATWPVDGPARLVIASSDVHGGSDQPIDWPIDFEKRQSTGAIIEVLLA